MTTNNDISEGFWVFVSHSTKDFERVRLVRNALENKGFRPILFYLKCLEDENEVNDLLKREIDARKRFILCDSPNAQASKFVQSEIDYIKKKKRMYEIIDLSKIDLDSTTLENEILELIKPFERRTSVFLSYSNKDYLLAKEILKTLDLYGFKGFDADFYGPWSGNAPWQDLKRLIRISIEGTLDNGYVVHLISSNTGIYTDEELEYSYTIDPIHTFPVLIEDIEQSKLPKVLRQESILNVSQVQSISDKAITIVEKLIEFDLTNHYNKGVNCRS